MTTVEFELQLRAFLVEGPSEPPSELVERALAEAHQLPQLQPRRLRWLGEGAAARVSGPGHRPPAGPGR